MPRGAGCIQCRLVFFFRTELTVDQTSTGGSSHVAGEGVPADCVLLEETLGSRSVVTKGTCVTGCSQDCSDSSVRGTEQASQDSPEDVSSNSSTPECPTANVLSCVPAARSPSKKYKQTIRRLQAKVAAQRKTIKTAEAASPSTVIDFKGPWHYPTARHRGGF